ncbi:heterokaryon incompatibility protein-domain-containing protein [Xylaria cf. heliscus]|nr:heterokaryon incompatibility protein-domain-containing protein [Xylaria cf. heliscus]
MSTAICIIASFIHIKQQLGRMAAAVSPILVDLSNKDSRFLFIKDSFDEFLYGDYGLYTLEWQLKALETIPSTPPESEETSIDQVEDKFRNRYIHLPIVLHDIVNTAIYEILSIFDIDITLARVPKITDSLVMSIGLLKELYQESRDLALRQAKTISFNPLTPSPQERNEYQYSDRLGSSNIRILSIQPGLEGSSMECQLEKRNLDNDIIEEALSYVWGKPKFDKTIKLDGKLFRITTSLNNILRSLRHRNVPRRIWIDAICINQLDLEEKNHQVRLMGKIYSKAQTTIIWLGDHSTKHTTLKPNLLDTAIDNLTSGPNKFGSNTVDEYDLPYIFEKVVKYQEDRLWDEERCALSILLYRCVNIIRTHKWWERVWTIQEAALAPNEPIIWFCGHTFSYSTLMAAIDVVDSIMASIRDSDGESSPVKDVYYELMKQSIVGGERKGDVKLIRSLRKHMASTSSSLIPSNSVQSLLPWFLQSVHAHRATDPRDKIFALQSLLLKSEGLLINVNYHEPTEPLFRRITAQCFNQAIPFLPLHYNLLIESRNNVGDMPQSSSWVLDFSHSRAGRENSTVETLYYRFLHGGTNLQPLSDHPPEGAWWFASPKTLFCSGVAIGMIHDIFIVPDLTKHLPEDVRQVFQNIIQWWELSIAEEQREWPMITNSTTTADGDKGAFENQGSNPGPSREEVMRLVTFGSPIFDYLGTSISMEMLKQERLSLRRLSGTYLFIAKGGILGLATAHVQKGDMLAIIHKYPNYVILRDTHYQDVPAQDKEKHRIVARAVVAESQDKMRSRIAKGFESCTFQII